MTVKSKGDGVQVDETAKRKRGRPSKGDPILIRLAPSERAVAELLGGGVIAEGIRLSLVASGRMGVSAIRLLAAETKTGEKTSGE